MKIVKKAIEIFEKSIEDYHIKDDVDTPITNLFEEKTIDNLFYEKNWIDTVQWHLEDIIRDPNISPEEALKIKRRIDSSNQDRTDLVEKIDDFLLFHYKDVEIKSNSKINTETPAWAFDRLSILCLKIYHMKIEAERKDASEEHLEKCTSKLKVLLEQKVDLSTALQTLLTDIENGEVTMKVYRQMKMYNDESLNPILYKKNS